MSGMPLGSLVLVLLLAPLLPGVATRTRALLTGRRGAPVRQLYSDLAKLWRKGVVYSTSTTWIFRLAPVVVLVTAILAACLLPLDGREAVVSFSGDLIAFAALLALGRFFLVLAGLDTGSSFEGMGASREVTFASFAEPALFLCFIALVRASGSLSLTGMLGGPLADAWPSAAPSLLMVAAALFAVLLAENSRVPVDDPATHLELTMIHEVIVLDHSGPDLALILYGGALKLALFGALLVGVLIPRANLAPAASLALLALGLVVVAALVGVVESVMARLRLDRVPQFLVAASALAFFAVVLLLW
ncbi:MAG TPA: NADH-quinone oxidoreductase subunit H [Gemmatimonadales bacterium]|jgi:formate hydrogenlyase subunit 4